MLKGLKNTRTKWRKVRHKTNRLVEQTTKQQRVRLTPGLFKIYWKFYHTKMKNFRLKFRCLSCFSQNIDCGYSLEPPQRGGSNEYPQSMFLSRNKKKKYVYPCRSHFYYIKMGFKWGQHFIGMFSWWLAQKKEELRQKSHLGTAKRNTKHCSRGTVIERQEKKKQTKTLLVAWISLARAKQGYKETFRSC